MSNQDQKILSTLDETVLIFPDRQDISALTISRGATALLINRTSGKGLIVDSTSANGPLFRNPFLAL